MKQAGPSAADMPPAVMLDMSGLQAMIDALRAEGREVYGPVTRDAALDYAPIQSTDELATGWVDEQSGGRYRLHRAGEAVFGATLGPSSWKRILHPPRQELWRTEIGPDGVRIVATPPDETLRAFIGVRPCDLAAIAVQDRVYLDGPTRDPHYAARRARAFLVAVNCTRAAETCFCASMGTGPRATAAHDIALTELAPGQFLAEAGSDAGAGLLARLPARPASPDDRATATKAIAQAAAQSRRIDTEGLPAALTATPDSPLWAEIGDRCLGCANCSMVCPTCFCTTMEDHSALDGSTTAREIRWAWCFTTDFSHVHGGPVRASRTARYRQWATHKLASWVDQFGTFGCVGCGRCITWCPVGIDITQTANAFHDAVRPARQADLEAAGG